MTVALDEKYQELRKCAKNICKSKKKECLKKQLEEIEQLSKQNEMRRLYSAVNKMSKGYQPNQRGCRSTEDVILYNQEEIMNRWVEHFCEVLNKKEDDTNEQDTGKEDSSGEVDINGNNYMEERSKAPTDEEVEKSIKRLKSARGR